MRLLVRLSTHLIANNSDIVADPTFNKHFMITFKSFMDLDELFELLVQRYWIQPPDNLNPEEREDWGRQKQNMIRLRYVLVFRPRAISQPPSP